MKHLINSRKILTITIALLALLAIVAFIQPVILAAGEDPCATGSATAGSEYCQSLKGGGTDNPFLDTISKVSTVVAFVAGILAVMWIIFMGIKMQTSSGDPQKVTAARNGIIYAAVGLVVVIVARSVVAFIISKL